MKSPIAIVMWAGLLMFAVDLLIGLRRWHRGGASDVPSALMGMLPPIAFLLDGTVGDTVIIVFLLVGGIACFIWRSRLRRAEKADAGRRDISV